MKLLFPTMSNSSLTDPALMCTHLHDWYCLWISDTGSHYHNDLLHLVMSGLWVLACGRRAVKCIILTIAYSLKSVGVATGWISNHNDTNKHDYPIILNNKYSCSGPPTIKSGSCKLRLF